MGRGEWEVEMKLHIKSCIINCLDGISNFYNSQYNSLIHLFYHYSVVLTALLKLSQFSLLVLYFYCNWLKKFVSNLFSIRQRSDSTDLQSMQLHIETGGMEWQGQQSKAGFLYIELLQKQVSDNYPSLKNARNPFKEGKVFLAMFGIGICSLLQVAIGFLEHRAI